MHSLPAGWNTLLTKLGFTRKKRRTRVHQNHFGRRTRFESLEPRKMLATYIVNTAVDELDLSVTDGDISLRDAIREASLSSGNTVVFNASVMNGATIGHRRGF